MGCATVGRLLASGPQVSLWDVCLGAPEWATNELVRPGIVYAMSVAPEIRRNTFSRGVRKSLLQFLGATEGIGLEHCGISPEHLF